MIGVRSSDMAPTGLSPMSIETAVIHTGVPKVFGSAVMPIFQSATYGYSGDGNEDLVAYTRPADSPNHHVRHSKRPIVRFNSVVTCVSFYICGPPSILFARFCRPVNVLEPHEGMQCDPAGTCTSDRSDRRNRGCSGDREWYGSYQQYAIGPPKAGRPPAHPGTH